MRGERLGGGGSGGDRVRSAQKSVEARMMMGFIFDGVEGVW